MRKSVRTALLAAADDSVLRVLPFLLAAAGISLEETAADGVSALEAVACCRPDLLIADQLLAVLPGNVLAENILQSTSLSVRPKVLLLYRREFPVPNRAKLESLGAVFMPWPADAAALNSALECLSDCRHSFSEKLLDRADALLESLGFASHAGTAALKYAVLLCAEDERLLHGRSKRLYPMVAEMLNLPVRSVERALRHAIGAAWQSDKFENQHRIFADTVDARRGQPTCGEMIACLADILRMEG